VNPQVDATWKDKKIENLQPPPTLGAMRARRPGRETSVTGETRVCDPARLS
jgi:hypothetical protein